MGRQETIKAICEMPVELRKPSTQGNPTGLLQVSGYFEESVPPTEWHYAAYIHEHPELVQAWYEHMGDQRCVPAWVLSKPGEDGSASWRVYRYPDIPATPYPDASRACGALIARYTASLVETIRYWEERDKNKGRKRKKSQPQVDAPIELQNSNSTLIFKPKI